MRRRFFTLLSALSLALCLATVALWVRSHWVMEQISWSGTGGMEWVQTPRGYLQLAFFRADWSNRPNSDFRIKYVRDEATPPINYLPLMNSEPGDKYLMWERAGFAWYSRHELRTGNLHLLLLFPFWSIVSVLAVLPLAWTIRWSRRREHSLGLCATCGYDLRATPEQCPECGAIAVGASA
jgi:hypothetical protein